MNSEHLRREARIKISTTKWTDRDCGFRSIGCQGMCEEGRRVKRTGMRELSGGGEGQRQRRKKWVWKRKRQKEMQYSVIKNSLAFYRVYYPVSHTGSFRAEWSIVFILTSWRFKKVVLILITAYIINKVLRGEMFCGDCWFRLELKELSRISYKENCMLSS